MAYSLMTVGCIRKKKKQTNYFYIQCFPTYHNIDLCKPICGTSSGCYFILKRKHNPESNFVSEYSCFQEKKKQTNKQKRLVMGHARACLYLLNHVCLTYLQVFTDPRKAAPTLQQKHNLDSGTAHSLTGSLFSLKMQGQSLPLIMPL